MPYSMKIDGGRLVLTGEMEDWADIVSAGQEAAKAAKKIKGRPTVVNKIVWTGGEIPAMSVPPITDTALEGLKPDVLIVGAGVTGAAIARELSKYKLDILLVEKEHDVALQASSRNDGMVHPGIDLHKGTLKYRYNMRGNRLYDKICEELQVPFNRCGQYLCFTAPFIPLLYASLAYWKWLGVPARVIGKKELQRLEPHLEGRLKAALFFPSSGIVCPYQLVIALVENAVQNGVRLSLDTAVLGIKTSRGGAGAQGKIDSVVTNRGTIYPKLLINAAGVWADRVAEMAGDEFFSIHPRRGTNSILDKKARALITNGIVAAMGKSISKKGRAKSHSKGGGVVSTVDKNVLIGPDAIETPERENYATRPASIENSFNKFRHTTPALNENQIITYFTGVRAPTYEEDFIVEKGRQTANIIHAAGIQSPGLTAAPAIAEDVARYAIEMLEAR